MQAVCEETGLPSDIMTVRWDKELGEKCGETWASRGTTLSCAAAQQAAQKLAADLEELVRRGAGTTTDRGRRSSSWSAGSTTASTSELHDPARARPKRS